MKPFLLKEISRMLRQVADKIDTGNCDLTLEEAMEIMSVISHERLSKEQARSYLNLSRSRFDALVEQNKIPKGRKVRGYKELIWYKDELRECI